MKPNKRNKMLGASYLGANVMCGDRKLKLSPGRLALLRQWENPVICGMDAGEQVEVDLLAGAEVMLILTADKDTLREMMNASEEDRRRSTMAFAIDYEDHIEESFAGLLRKLEELGASVAEPGKRMAAAAATHTRMT